MTILYWQMTTFVQTQEAVGLRFLAYDCTTHPACPTALPTLNRTQGLPQFTYRSTYMWQAHGKHPQDICWPPGHADRFTVAGHYFPAPLIGGENTAGIPYSLSVTHPEWFWPPPDGACLYQFLNENNVFCIENNVFCIKNDEICIKNDEICI